MTPNMNLSTTVRLGHMATSFRLLMAVFASILSLITGVFEASAAGIGGWSPSCVVNTQCPASAVSAAEAKLDINRDCRIDSKDVSQLNSFVSFCTGQPKTGSCAYNPLYDVNAAPDYKGDGFNSPLDSLAVIDYVNRVCPIYGNDTFIMGYIPETVEDNVSYGTSGFNNCYAAIGNSLYLESHASASIHPRLDISAGDGRISRSTNFIRNPADPTEPINPSANIAFFCMKGANGSLVDASIKAGSHRWASGVQSGSVNIGAGQQCILSVSAFDKRRGSNGGGAGTMNAKYDAATGNITVQGMDQGYVIDVTYICADPKSTNKTPVHIGQYSRDVSGASVLLAKDLQVGPGINHFSLDCSGNAVGQHAYDRTTGMVYKGGSIGCGSGVASYSYLGVGGAVSAIPACRDGKDNDGDGLIDFPADPGCVDVNDVDETNQVDPGGAQCNDGIDNDNDGLVDAYSELAPDNGQVLNVAPTGDAALEFRRIVEANVKAKKFPNMVAPGKVALNGSDVEAGILRSVSPGVNVWTNAGSDNPTNGILTDSLTQVCRVLGFKDYVSSTCRDSERSSTYPNGKCNFHGATDNRQWAFENGNFVVKTADPKYEKTWVASIQCKNKLSACNDGWDNDGDGKVDSADDGCANSNDNSEGKPDTKCSSPTSTTEFEQCRDGKDNDADGLIDQQDPACRTVFDNPSTYNPALDNEAANFGKVELIGPSGSIRDGRPTYSWKSISPAVSRYLVEIYRGQELQYSFYFNGTSVRPDLPLQFGVEHNFRVRAVDANNNPISFFSDPMKFAIVLAGPGMISPDGPINVSRPTFEWTAIPFAAQYELQVFDKATGSLVLQGFSATTSLVATVDLVRGRTYQSIVRVVNTNRSVAGDWSTPLDFLVVEPTPTPTNTPTPTSTATATFTYTATATATFTNTPQPTSTATPTYTHTAVATVTIAPTNTSTPMPTATATRTATFTPSATSTSTVTPTHTPTYTSTATATQTATPTPTGEPSLLTVGVECVTRNIDGTRTAYFSYNNLTGGDIAVASDTALGTINEFKSSTTTATPPKTFKLGQAKGAVVVPYTSGSVTWTVKAPKSARSEAIATELSPECPAVQPLADCRGYTGGVLKVKLGYTNPGSFEQSVPVGKLNGFSGSATDRGQPNRFFSGLNSAVFEVPLADPNEKVTWNVNGKSVVIDNTLKVCSGQCVDLPVGAIKGDLDQIAAELSALVNKAAAALESVKDRDNDPRSRARDRSDAAQARKKSQSYERLAQGLLLQYPAVVKTCPEAPALCVTVDRQGNIDGLRWLYANQRNTVMRVMNRVFFRSTGKVNRNARLIRDAKALEQQGLVQLSKLPRFSTECK